MAKKGLGRGFDSLIPTDLFDDSFNLTKDNEGDYSQLRILKLSDIVADPHQPRQYFDEGALKELTESIKRHGVVQPIVVTKKDNLYEIVAGERRFRASKAAGKKTIPAIVRSIDDQHRLELALIENLQRHDLNALETAIAYAKLRDQFNLSLEAIGQAVGGKSVSAVSNTLRLLRLPAEVKAAIGSGELTEGQARPLVDVDEHIIKPLLPRIIAEKWSARLVEQTVRRLKTSPQKQDTTKKTIARLHEADIDRIGARLRTSVKVITNASGKGKIVIEFNDEQEFSRLRDLLGYDR
jgi:ParB family chromosome partitioning protein